MMLQTLVASLVASLALVSVAFPAVTGVRKFAVLPIYATATPPVPRSALLPELTGPGWSVDAYLREASSGLLTPQWVIEDWRQMPFGDDCGSRLDAVVQARIASGLSADHQFIYFIWPPGGCPSRAHSQEAFINGLGAGRTEGQIGVGTVAHELGHSLLGLADNYNSPSENQYGLMARGESRTPRHPSLPAKLKVGWMPASNVPRISGPGYYTFMHSEQVIPGAVQGLEIQIGSGTLTLDYRRPYGEHFETFAAGHWGTEGVSVFERFGRWAQLVDATPETGRALDKTLRPGNSYYDSSGDYTVTTLAVDEQTATVWVTLGAPPTTSTAELVGTTLFVAALGGIPHDILARVDGGAYQISDRTGSPITAGVGCHPVPGEAWSVRCPAAAIARLVVTGGPGDDTIEFVGSQSVSLYGGPGNDVVTGGDGDDIVSGGDGRDFVYGGLGQDRVSAGAGVIDPPEATDQDELHGGGRRRQSGRWPGPGPVLLRPRRRHDGRRGGARYGGLPGPYGGCQRHDRQGRRRRRRTG